MINKDVLKTWLHNYKDLEEEAHVTYRTSLLLEAWLEEKGYCREAEVRYLDLDLSGDILNTLTMLINCDDKTYIAYADITYIGYAIEIEDISSVEQVDRNTLNEVRRQYKRYKAVEIMPEQIRELAEALPLE